MIVIDTNVVSELMRPDPAPVVKRWSLSRDVELYTTSVTLAEVHYGVERLPKGRRKEELRSAAEGLIADFEDRILTFDAKAAQPYAVIVCGRERAGLPIETFDAQIAAVCRGHEVPVATRNIKDFKDTGIDVINPWQAPSRN